MTSFRDRWRLIPAAGRALAVRVAGARAPLAARIQVTQRCAARCLYCKLPAEGDVPLSTGELERILAELAELGCLRISFSGGEPMLRQDIGALVDRCADLGMAPEMNASGAGFVERSTEVSRLRLLKLSLDGPPAVHDRQRGREGSHAEVLASARRAREMGIRVVLVTTITRHNVDRLDHVLEVARREGVLAAFQPLKPYYKGLRDVEELLPEPTEMTRAVQGLIEARRGAYRGTLRNSLPGLRHLSRWPDYGELRCWAGRIFCIVGADGTLYPCDRTRLTAPLPNVQEQGVARAMARLPEPDCDGCGFCGALELNLALDLDWRIAGTILRLVR